MPIKILIDTDIGDDIDDAWALCTALRHPNLKLVGLTTVHSDTELRAAEARYLIETAGVQGIEVAAGTRDCLDRVIPIRRNNQADILTRADEERLRQGRTDGVRFMAEKSLENEGLTLVAYGPLTNVARFKLEFPKAFQRLKRLVLMCGHLLPDRSEPEYNASTDPRATQVVFESKKPIIMIGLDVTLQCQLLPEDLETLRKKDGSLTNALLKMTELWQRASGKPEKEFPMPIMHDPLAVLVAAGEPVVKLEPMHIQIDAQGRCLKVPGKPNVQVAVQVNPTAVRQKLIEVIK